MCRSQNYNCYNYYFIINRCKIFYSILFHRLGSAFFKVCVAAFFAASFIFVLVVVCVVEFVEVVDFMLFKRVVTPVGSACNLELICNFACAISCSDANHLKVLTDEGFSTYPAGHLSPLGPALLLAHLK